MKIKTMRPFWLACGLFGVFFMVLLSIRLDLYSVFLSRPQDTPVTLKTPVSESDTWMNIFQGGRKIGYSHTTFLKDEKGYHLNEGMIIRINTMGMAQDLSLNISGRLNYDYTLSSFDFDIRSGRFRFKADGTVNGDILSITTQSDGDASRQMDIRIKEKIYVTSGIIRATRYPDLEPGKTLSFQIFDPVSMRQEPIFLKVVGEEDIRNMGVTKKAKKLEITFKDATQHVWIGKTGEVLREEGVLGIRFERASREDVLFGASMAPSQDLTQVASVPSNITIADVQKLERLELEIVGILHEKIHLHGGRQQLNGNVLVITKESLTGLAPSANTKMIKDIDSKFLRPSSFVQSDHPKIVNLVNTLISQDDTPFERADKMIHWIYNHIEKRPVISLPDAVSTLMHRVGDCNEHAVLLAALARAAGIPAKVEAGLVYLNGRFYYHAWNLLYFGKWITADSLFNQLPADVTHIRLISGTPSQQFDLIHTIGKIKLRVIKHSK